MFVASKMKKLLFFLLPILFLILSCNVHTYYQSEYQEHYSKNITYKCAVSGASIYALGNICSWDNEGAVFSFSDDGIIYLKLYLFTCSEDENNREIRSEYREIDALLLKFMSNNPVSYSIRGETSSNSSIYQTEQMKGLVQDYEGAIDFKKNDNSQRLKSIFIRFECPKNTVLKIDCATVI